MSLPTVGPATGPVADPVRLEPLRWWHIEAAAGLEAETFGDTAWSAETFWSELARPETRCYTGVLDAADRLVGYAGLMVTGAGADVQTLAVAAAARGRGLGARLLRHLLAAADERGARTVLLEVRRDNGPALALYARHGFEQIARRSSYYGPGQDAVIMRRGPG